MRVWLLLVALAAAGCPSGSDEPQDAGPPDAAEPLERSLELCLRVGRAFCKGMTTCRPFTSSDGHCLDRWELYQCHPPEAHTETTATLCAAEWEARALDCSTWWARGWFESTAPLCADVLLP